jgi:HKD family nuclease
MKKYTVTYLLDNKEWTEELSEGQLKNLEKRLERGCEEKIISIEEIHKPPSSPLQAFQNLKRRR